MPGRTAMLACHPKQLGTHRPAYMVRYFAKVVAKRCIQQRFVVSGIQSERPKMQLTCLGCNVSLLSEVQEELLVSIACTDAAVLCQRCPEGNLQKQDKRLAFANAWL